MGCGLAIRPQGDDHFDSRLITEWIGFRQCGCGGMSRPLMPVRSAMVVVSIHRARWQISKPARP